jgi:hypothetical protein
MASVFPQFVADALVKDRLAKQLKQDPANLPDYWDQIVADAHEAATNDIYGALLARGYTQTQIQSWDRGAEFEKMQAVYYCLTEGAGLAGYDDKWVAKLDRRATLKTVAVTAAGVFQAPQGTSAGVVGFGYLDEALTQRPGIQLTGAGYKDINTQTQW